MSEDSERWAAYGALLRQQAYNLLSASEDASVAAVRATPMDNPRRQALWGEFQQLKDSIESLKSEIYTGSSALTNSGSRG